MHYLKLIVKQEKHKLKSFYKNLQFVIMLQRLLSSIILINIGKYIINKLKIKLFY